MAPSLRLRATRSTLDTTETSSSSTILPSIPTDSQPLWEGMFQLLSDFDMFLYWPGERLIAAMARDDVPLPEGMPAERVVVRSATDLRSLVEGN